MYMITKRPTCWLIDGTFMVKTEIFLHFLNTASAALSVARDGDQLLFL